MRILILTQYFLPEIGATQVRLSAMVTQLVRSGCEVEVITAMPNYPDGVIHPDYRGRLYSREIWNGIPLHRVWLYPSMGAGAKRMLNYLSFSVTCLLGFMRAKRPDIIFVESPPLFLSLPAWLMSRLWRRPFVFNVADLWPDSVRAMKLMNDGVALKMAGVLERWSYRSASHVNAVTEGIRRTLVEDKGVDPRKALFLPNGVDTTMFAPRPPDTALAQELGVIEKKVIVYAGNLGFVHGVTVGLEGMRLLKERHPELHLIVIGNGSERDKLVRYAEEQGLSNVQFLKPRPPEYIARLYSIAVIGFGCLIDYPLAEGVRSAKLFPIMASGRPVVFSGLGEGARIIEQAQAGIVTPPSDARALAAAFASVAGDPDLAARLGNNGRAFVEKNLQWSRLMDDWLAQLRYRGANPKRNGDRGSVGQRGPR
jgi:putative colanic acid biosynthesis glycosyltransferase WcaI